MGRPYNCSPINVNGKPCKDFLLSEQSASGLPDRSMRVIHQHGLWLALMKRGKKEKIEGFKMLSHSSLSINSHPLSMSWSLVLQLCLCLNHREIQRHVTL